MVNEEDHIRLQVLTAGSQLKEAWNIANELDDKLEDKLDIAFSKRWGYLTACPTNLGTGLRVSVMVHLPALNLTNNIGQNVDCCIPAGPGCQRPLWRGQ